MSGEVFTYRPGTPEDGRELLLIHKRAVQLIAIHDYTKEIALSWVHGLTPEGYGQSMTDGEAFEVVVAGGRVIAFCGSKEDEVCGLYVDPDYMRRGIASALLRRAVERITQRGFKHARVVASFTAVSLYKRHGFYSLGERPRATRGGLEMTVVDMVRQLSRSNP